MVRTMAVDVALSEQLVDVDAAEDMVMMIGAGDVRQSSVDPSVLEQCLSSSTSPFS